MSKALVVFSGGQDSTTCLYWAKKQYDEVYALTFDYGQRHSQELAAANKIADMAEIAGHEILTLPAGILESTSPLVDLEMQVDTYADADSLPGGLEDTFVPARNILFLTLAANRAMALGCGTIVAGVSAEDSGGYPDCTHTFIISMGHSLRLGLGEPRMRLMTPLVKLSKAATVELALALGAECMVALGYSHTCYKGQVPPCGGCHACLLRAKGFDEAGVPDPLVGRVGVSQ